MCFRREINPEQSALSLLPRHPVHDEKLGQRWIVVLAQGAMLLALKQLFFCCSRLSFSKNGVVRIDGFSTPDQYDDEALSLWTHENYEDDEFDLESIKYILGYIGDKFCQMVTSEKAAMTWVKKDGTCRLTLCVY